MNKRIFIAKCLPLYLPLMSERVTLDNAARRLAVDSAL